MANTASTRKSTAKPAVLFALLIGFSALVGWRFWRDADRRSDELVLAGEIFGTTYSVKAYGDELGGEAKALQADIDALLAEIDGAMSTYKPDSDLSRFNASESTEAFEVHPSLATVVTKAQRVSEESNGAFDVTVKPLVDAWGFGAKGRVPEPPDDLEQVMGLIGHAKVSVEAGALRKSNPAVTVDLSAIAKGWAVDEVARVLGEHGIEAYMVEIGGEIVTRGETPRGPWRIGIERPRLDNGRGVQTVVALSDIGMATSGDYRNYHEYEGRRVSHTIDARTGRPIEHNLASVTVLHSECAMADAYATAINVLGPEEGMELAERLELPVLMLVREPGTEPAEFTERASLAFEAFRAQD